MSIASVLGAHCRYADGFPQGFDRAFAWIFDGDLGVRMFFIISGFLITWLMLVEFDRSNRVSLWRFYARRALRILPVYYAFLLVLIALQLSGAYWQPAAAWVRNLTFTTNFCPFRSMSWASGHLWSLAVEEQFYILWPCLFVLSGCGRNMRRIFCILALPVCVAPLARAVSYLNAAPLHLGILFPPFSFFNYFDSLAIGCACAVLFARRPTEVRLLATARPWLIFVVGVTMVVIPHCLRVSLMFGDFTVPFGFTCEGFGLALLLMQSLNSPRFGFYPILNLAGVRGIGVLSYSIYIWQQLFCTRPEVFGMGHVWWMSFPFWIISALLVSAVSYFGLERPLFRLRAHFRTPAAAQC